MPVISDEYEMAGAVTDAAIREYRTEFQPPTRRSRRHSTRCRTLRVHNGEAAMRMFVESAKNKRLLQSSMHPKRRSIP